MSGGDGRWGPTWTWKPADTWRYQTSDPGLHPPSGTRDKESTLYLQNRSSSLLFGACGFLEGSGCHCCWKWVWVLHLKKSDLWDLRVPLLSLQLQFPHGWVSLRHYTLKMRPFVFLSLNVDLNLQRSLTREHIVQPSAPHASLLVPLSGTNFNVSS